MSKQIRDIFKKMGITKGESIDEKAAKINEEIIKSLRLNINKDSVMDDFLFKLIDLELEHTGTEKWHFKESYNQLVKQYSSKWVEGNENR
jgi:hypothetical protein